jgi:hypothetical protein
MNAYAADGNDRVVPVRIDSGGQTVPVALNVPQAEGVKSVGLELKIGTIWSCPGRPSLVGKLPRYDPGSSPPQWVIGYQYMGGMTNWGWNTGGQHPAHSPVKLANSKPYWALAADALVRGSKWGALAGSAPTYTDAGSTFSLWDGIPAHRNVGSQSPAGGNEVFADGSARWVKYETMWLLHNYAGGSGPRNFFWYQDPTDFEAALLSAVTTTLSAKNFP